MKHLENIILGILLLTVACSCVKFEPVVRYTEPDDTWNHATFNPSSVTGYHGARSKRGYVYWIIYTDHDYGWSDQVISMDWETMSAVILILKAPLEDRDRLMDEYGPVILYKQGCQPVLVLTDKDWK